MHKLELYQKKGLSLKILNERLSFLYESGAAENRTRVQTRKPDAFYMLIMLFDFRLISGNKHPKQSLVAIVVRTLSQPQSS